MDKIRKIIRFVKRLFPKTPKMKFIYAWYYKHGKINEKQALFESFHGKDVSDSSLAILQEFLKMPESKDFKIYFATNDKKRDQKFIDSIGLKVELVDIADFKYVKVLATSKYLINNSSFPAYFIRRDEQVYLQTWHGTPLKKLALDMDRMDMGGSTDIENYHEQFRVTCKDWDYLVSQNKFSTDIFRSCFAFKDRPILQIGYPRNDILINDNSPAKIREYKEKLGLPLDKKIILYAPTWRDNEYSEKGKYKFASKLDFDKAKEALSDEYIFIVKYHYLVSDKIDWTPYKGFVYTFDETKDIAWLYLVSDMLITDYSSVMFDYSILNRPMLFFAYDLEDYKENLRGFYFDFVNDIPGPISRDTDQLIKDIKEYNEDSWKEKYKNYHDKFNGIDDGHASQKVIDVIKKVSR